LSLLFSRSSALVIIFSSPPTSGSNFDGKLDGLGSIGLKTLVFETEDDEEDDFMA
jgi:hypothetical protein